MSEQLAVKRHLRFERRPSPVLVEHRPLYKISQLLLVLHLASRGGKSSLARLHLFNWALKREDRTLRLVEAVKDKELRVNAWGFDPAVAFALRYAIAESLIETTSTGYQIGSKGTTFIEEVLRDADVLGAERNFLQKIGKGITEGMVDSVAKGWESA
jgi:hypothetical protein